MSNVLEIQGLGKRYPGARKDAPWALTDIDLSVEQGEVVSIIGRNGAGKSTLLKVAAGVSPVTQGTVRRAERVAPLIEVGAGFHPELSGRENVSVNGRLLGMTRKQIRNSFDAIVDFAGLAHVIDEPVKNYSSGMFMRLGFAVAVHTEPELLLVDEVLAVGDLPFQLKCMERIRELRARGAGVLFVSHNLAAVADASDRAMLLENGRCISSGVPSAVIGDYHKRLEAAGDSGPGGVGTVVLDSVTLLREDGTVPPVWRPSERAVVRVRVHAEDDVPESYFGIQIDSEAAGMCQRSHPDSWMVPALAAGESIEIETTIDLAMGPGGYSLDVGLVTRDWITQLMWRPGAMQFAVDRRVGSRGPIDLNPRPDLHVRSVDTEMPVTGPAVSNVVGVGADG
jgi:ABC-type polysaccharide/polyol phosphate transport system ATPase subunit